MWGIFTDLFAEVAVGVAVYLWHAKLAFLAGIGIARLLEYARRPRTATVERNATIADM